MIEQLFPSEAVAVTATPEMWEMPLLPEEVSAVAGAVCKRRHEFAAGRACARQALSRLGIKDFSLKNDSDGVPIWPQGVIGSISHCEGYCGAVVTRMDRIRSLGFDAEPASPLPPDIRSHVCSKTERDWIERQPAPPFGDWYKLFFCAKESAFKAVFPLVRRPFDFWELEIRLRPSSSEFDVRFPWPFDAATGQLLGRFAISQRHILTGVTILRARLLPLSEAQMP